MTAIESFITNVSISDGCWEWVGYRNSFGYGRVRVSGNRILAHRLSWIVNRGHVPKGKCVLHRCDNPSCVMPDHLFLGTVEDNNSDRHSKGRSKGPIGIKNIAVREPWRMTRGECHPNSKLTDSSVSEIRKMRVCGDTLQSIADKFRVSKKTILNITQNKTWNHVK